MCGRYYVDDATAREIEKLVKEIDAKMNAKAREGKKQPGMQMSLEQIDLTQINLTQINLRGEQQTLNAEQFPEHDRARDVHPTETASVLRAEQTEGKSMEADYQYWGFPSPAGREGSAKMIINARSETAQEKPMFAESLRQRRIIVPAKGFYEWGKDRTKYRFVPEDDSILYMAGIYRPYDGKNRFVILTKGADEVMSPVHDRMPLLIRKQDVSDWVMEPNATGYLLREGKVRLERKANYEQLSLF